jgi:hypothetical protein
MEFSTYDDGDEETDGDGIEDPSADGQAHSEDTGTSEASEPPEPDVDDSEDMESDDDGGRGLGIADAAQAAREAVPRSDEDGDSDGATAEEDTGLLPWVIVAGIGALVLLGDGAADLVDDLLGGGNSGPPGV